MLSAEGMSTRAIAPIVGASKDTVSRDLSGVSHETPEPVQGMDGKTYTRPTSTPTSWLHRVETMEPALCRDRRCALAVWSAPNGVARATPNARVSACALAGNGSIGSH